MTKKSGKSKPNITEALEDLCVNILAHERNDYEVTLSGNGTNACEAGNAAYAILDILHGDSRRWIKKNAKRIDELATELRKEYDGEDEESEE